MRLDKFLFAARIFPSRSLGAEAISSSMVFVDNLVAKPAKEVHVGAIIEIDTPRFYKKIQVVSLPPKNMPKKNAASIITLLEERTKD